jgi:DtxR family Mn-dependent transcriptional regulator
VKILKGSETVKPLRDSGVTRAGKGTGETRDRTGGGPATVSVENYLKAIYHQGQGGRGVIAARLKETLKVSAPAVTAAVRRLSRQGYVTVDRRRMIALTPQGLEVARHLIARHRLVERLLTDVLGMEWYRVHEEAERLEHAISPEVEARLLRIFGDRHVCPHGSSFIPEGPEPRRRRGERLLAEAAVNQSLRVTEVDDEDRGFLEYLDGLGIMPGRRLTLRERLYDATLRLQVDGRSVHLAQESAARVWVRPVASGRPRGLSRA